MSIQIVNNDAQGKLRRLERDLNDLTPLMRELSGALLDSIQQSFDEQRDPVTGLPWAELSEATKANRRGGEPYEILVDTAILRNSFQAQHSATEAQAGTNLVYASTHQFGAKRGAFGTTGSGRPIPWGDIPARPMMGFGPRLTAEVEGILDRYLRQAVT